MKYRFKPTQRFWESFYALSPAISIILSSSASVSLTPNSRFRDVEGKRYSGGYRKNGLMTANFAKRIESDEAKADRKFRLYDIDLGKRKFQRSTSGAWLWPRAVGVTKRPSPWRENSA